MKAAQIHQPNQMEIVTLPAPQPGADEVLIRVRASGICGTDIHIFRGEYLGAYPVIPGHEFAGVVEQIGSAVKRFKIGDRVAVEPNIACDNCENCLNNRQNFCLNWQAVGVTRPGGMAELVCTPEKTVFNIGDLPFEQGAFMEPLSCVLHGVERLETRLGERVAILGAGPIGCLLMQALRLRGVVHVSVADRNADRLQAAHRLGADAVFEDLAALKPVGYDAVVDATGAPAVMSRALEFARHGGKVLLFGVPPDGSTLSLPAFPIFRKGLTLLSSFTSLRNSLQAVELLRSGSIQVEPLISHRLPLMEFQRGIELIERGQENVMKVMLMPNG